MVHGNADVKAADAGVFSLTDDSINQVSAADRHRPVVFAMFGSDVINPEQNSSMVTAVADFTVGFTRRADVRVSFNNYYEAEFRSRGVPWSDKHDGLLFAYSDCRGSRREALAGDLARRGVRVDAIGPCLHNKELAELSPECAGLRRDGATFSAASDCALARYKFYLAIEDAEQEDYVTEVLWQGLRAGAVPVYLGAPNVRALVPHPDALVLVDDFATPDALAAYLLAAMASPALHARHTAWKDAPFLSRGWFSRRVLNAPLDSAACAVCDHLTSHAGRLLPLSATGHTSGVHVRRCIRERLARARFRHVVPVPVPRVDVPRAYVMTTTRGAPGSVASVRIAHIVSEAASVGLAALLVEDFDSANITAEDYSCWYPQDTTDPRPSVDRLYKRTLTYGEVSLSAKHYTALYDLYLSGLPWGLLLEDDVVFLGDFNSRVAATVEEAPPGWGVIFLNYGEDCAQRAPKQYRATPTLWRIASSCGTFAMAVSAVGARTMLAYLPLRWPIDNMMDFAVADEGLELYGQDPPTIKHGTFASMLENDRAAAWAAAERK